MKFPITTLLLTLTATAVLGMPAPEAEPLEERAAALEKRQSCKRVRRFLPDQSGVCVDTHSMK
ncbi:MAG: hypothetical protein LQ343_001883 [Gyalolechia ehrenbergii]|nr:MAG: hypothetical protein LQ343_001883 [Gyalolechia ehrenbergii]